MAWTLHQAPENSQIQDTKISFVFVTRNRRNRKGKALLSLAQLGSAWQLSAAMRCMSRCVLPVREASWEAHVYAMLSYTLMPVLPSHLNDSTLSNWKQMFSIVFLSCDAKNRTCKNHKRFAFSMEMPSCAFKNPVPSTYVENVLDN